MACHSLQVLSRTGRIRQPSLHHSLQALILDDNGLAAAPECVGSLTELRALSLCSNTIESLAPEARSAATRAITHASTRSA